MKLYGGTTAVATQPFSRTTIALLVVSVAAWVGTIAWAGLADMGAMPGTMGMSLLTFTAMWTLMMAAMMLPSVGPFMGVYQRTVTEHRGPRLTAMAGGYLAVWSASGVVAFTIAGWFGAGIVGKNPVCWLTLLDVKARDPIERP